jgi:hypothetical protein
MKTLEQAVALLCMFANAKATWSNSANNFHVQEIVSSSFVTRSLQDATDQPCKAQRCLSCASCSSQPLYVPELNEYFLSLYDVGINEMNACATPAAGQQTTPCGE